MRKIALAMSGEAGGAFREEGTEARPALDDWQLMEPAAILPATQPGIDEGDDILAEFAGGELPEEAHLALPSKPPPLIAEAATKTMEPCLLMCRSYSNEG